MVYRFGTNEKYSKSFSQYTAFTGSRLMVTKITFKSDRAISGNIYSGDVTNDKSSTANVKVKPAHDGRNQS